MASIAQRLAPASLARTPHRACEETLAKQPLALCSDLLDVAVLWNAKAGCTFAVKWLFYHEGILDEALAYSTWIHEYRQQVYCRRPGYDAKVRRIPSLGPRAIKFVRDPFDRAVSSYLHFAGLATYQAGPALGPILRDTARSVGRFARHPGSRTKGPLKSDAWRVYTWLRREHAPTLRALGAYLGRPVGGGRSFTFREYVSFLGSFDLDDSDPHLRRQVSRCEQLGLLPELTVLRIEKSAEMLPRLEDELGLRHSDLERLRSSGHHTRRAESTSFVGDTPYVRDPGQHVPVTRAFYDAALVASVAKLYAADIEAYGYPAAGPEGLG